MSWTLLNWLEFLLANLAIVGILSAGLAFFVSRLKPQARFPKTFSICFTVIATIFLLIFLNWATSAGGPLD